MRLGPGDHQLTAYLAGEGHVERLVAELRGVVEVFGQLVVTEGPEQRSYWALNVWRGARVLSYRSVSDAAQQLRAWQRSFWPYSFHLHRRTALVHERLPHVSARPLRFPEAPPTTPLGSFTLLDESTLLASADCSSPFPNGEPRFVLLDESQGPPSRAYLKLFEALTRFGVRPGPGERCLELGAAPGGWTWVLATLGAEVIAVDRAPLAPQVARLAGVTTLAGDAFAQRPERLGQVDWLCSDVICYPDKLLGFVRSWIEARACRFVVCTLKFQGDGGYAVADEFAALPGATVAHLFHNKHELTCLVRVPDRDA